jgi:tetratricopeptide (TPR) repeat protein
VLKSRLLLTETGLAIGLGVPFVLGTVWRLAGAMGWTWGAGLATARFITDLLIIAGLSALILRFERRPLGSIGLRKLKREDGRLGLTIADGVVGLTIAAAVLYACLTPWRSLSYLVTILSPMAVLVTLNAPLLLLIAVAMASAVAGEMAARGYAIGRLTSLTGNIWSAAGCAAVLSLISRMPLWGFHYTLLIAPAEIALASIYAHYRRLAPCIVARVLLNLVLLIPMLIFAAPLTANKNPFLMNSGSGSEAGAINDLNRSFNSAESALLPYLKRAQADVGKGDYDSAIGELTSVIKLDPKNPIWFIQRAALYSQAGQPEKAIGDYTTIIQLDPKAVNAYRYRGSNYTLVGDYSRAVADLNSAIKLAPNDAGLYAQRANIYLRQKQYSQALQDANRAVELAPTNKTFLSARAEIYSSLGNPDSAIADLNRVLKLSPEDPNAYQQRAALYLSKGDEKDALADLDWLQRLTGGNGALYYSRARLEMDLHEWKHVHDDLLRLSQNMAGIDAGDADWAAAILAMSSNSELRDGKAAVVLASWANNITNFRNSMYLGTLAAAYAESGDFNSAIKWQIRALALTDATDHDGILFRRQQLLDYRNGKPFRINEPFMGSPVRYPIGLFLVLSLVMLVLMIIGLLVLLYGLFLLFRRVIRAYLKTFVTSRHAG